MGETVPPKNEFDRFPELRNVDVNNYLSFHTEIADYHRIAQMNPKICEVMFVFYCAWREVTVEVLFLS